MRTLLEIGLANAVMATVLALLAAGVGLFCRRPAVRHVLWLLVLLKLITPPVMPVPVTCPAALGTLLPELNAPRPDTGPPPEGADGTQTALHGIKSQANDDPLFFDYQQSSPEAPENDHYQFATKKEVHASDAGPPPTLVAAPWSSVAFTVWVTGSVLWFAIAGLRIHRFHRLLSFGKPAPSRVQEQARLLAERLGLARCPTVRIVPGRISPLLWAFGGKVCLVVPADLWGRLGTEQQSALLAHELAHARRRDHWIRWLELVVTGIYWWLPVAWWARRQLQQAEEQCCDAWVVWTLPAAAKAYAKALLQTVDFLDARPALPPVASGVGHVHHLKRRLTMIVRQPLYPRLPWPVHLGAIVLGLLILPAAPQRLVAQDSAAKSPAGLSEETAVAAADQETQSRDLERRLRDLEDKMDRLLRKLESQPGEPSERGRRSEGRVPPAGERAKEKAVKEKEAKEAAKGKAKAERMKESKWRFEFDGKTMSPEQVEQLKKEIQEKVNKALDPQRMKELQQKIQEAVDKNVNPERMKELQKRIQEAVDRSISPERMEAMTRKIEEALKKSTAAAERGKSRQETRTNPADRPREQGQRDLERRMDRLEQKMDRVLQALEKSGKRTN